MKQGVTGSVIITTIICAGLLFVPVSRAAHATNFLDALYTEITNRVANVDTNATKRQRRALTAANAILKRNTKTFAADLSALAATATVLDTRFTNDTTLHDLENSALAAYSAEADAQLDAAELRVGTNSIARALSNQLAKARIALTNAESNTNRVADRAHELARVFNKLRAPVAKILKKYPEAPFAAPASVDGAALVLSEDAIVNDQTIFYFHTRTDLGETYYSYSSHNPEELGTWTYAKTGDRTAVIHCVPNYPPTYTTAHDMLLTFTSATTGNFVGVNSASEPIQGTFAIVP
jgi:hypothetical protein